jgi:cell division protein FtsB
MKGKNSLLLAILFAIIIALGAWKFWVMFNQWKQTNERLISLEIRYYKTVQDLTDYKNQVDLLNQKTAVLKADNAKLSKEKQELQEKISDLEKEEEIIKAKLHSIKELKQAIRQVRIEMHEQQVHQLLIRKEQQKALDAQELAIGNRGFITKNRQSTYKPKIRIEVMPVN